MMSCRHERLVETEQDAAVCRDCGLVLQPQLFETQEAFPGGVEKAAYRVRRHYLELAGALGLPGAELQPQEAAEAVAAGRASVRRPLLRAVAGVLLAARHPALPANLVRQRAGAPRDMWVDLCGALGVEAAPEPRALVLHRLRTEYLVGPALALRLVREPTGRVAAEAAAVARSARLAELEALACVADCAGTGRDCFRAHLLLRGHSPNWCLRCRREIERAGALWLL